MFSSLKYILTVFHIQCIADLNGYLSIIILTNFVELHSQMLHGEFPNQKTSECLEDFLNILLYVKMEAIWSFDIGQ